MTVGTNGYTATSALDSINISAELAEHNAKKEALFEEEKRLRHGILLSSFAKLLHF